MTSLPRRYRQFQAQYPELNQAYETLGSVAAGAGPLDEKTRELVKLGMASAMRAENAVHSHTHRALDAGATEAEVEHAILLGITTMGFPTMMTALTWMREALEKRDASRLP